MSHIKWKSAASSFSLYDFFLLRSFFGVGFFPSPLLVCLTFSVQYLFYTQISLLFTPSSLTSYFSMWYCMRGVQMGGGGGGGWDGVIWVMWRHSWIHAQIFASARFNVPTRFPIPGPSPAPCTAGDWRVDLCGSYVSKISQQQLRFDCLSRPARANWVYPLLLP